MLYETKFVNKTSGRVRLYSDQFGSDPWFLSAGQTETRQTPDQKNLWSPFKEIIFEIKYPEGKVVTKVKNRLKWKDPFLNENWVVRFFNGYGLDWELWDNPGSQTIYLPKGILVQVQVKPSSYHAKFKEIRN